MSIKRSTLLMVIALITTVIHATPHQGIDAKLFLDQSGKQNSEDVMVRLLLHNRTADPQPILKWFLPDAEGNLEEPILKVTKNGKPTHFLGPHYKRPAPMAEDYLVLEAHEKRTFFINLASWYDFSEPGDYVIQLQAQNRRLFTHVIIAGASRFDQLVSRSALIYKVSKGSTSTQCNPNKESCNSEPGGDPSPQPAVNFTGRCSAQEQSTVLDALVQSQLMADESLGYLNAALGDRYTTWFGSYNGGRWETARNNFVAIKDALDNQNKTFDCSCNKGYYAYVYPSEPYKIYLCRVFWTAPLVGTDSQAGTLIHEMSHFSIVADTDDYVYGQAGAKELAITDPFSAVNNADNNEYFAENTPFEN